MPSKRVAFCCFLKEAMQSFATFLLLRWSRSEYGWVQAGITISFAFGKGDSTIGAAFSTDFNFLELEKSGVLE